MRKPMEKNGVIFCVCSKKTDSDATAATKKHKQEETWTSTPRQIWLATQFQRFYDER